LGEGQENLVGRSLCESFPILGQAIVLQYWQVLATQQQITGVEVNTNLKNRGKVDLILNFSPLKNALAEIQGVTLVMDDHTERKRLEAQRKLLEKMVSPAVIHQLDPDSLRLGGELKEVTALFADLRGFAVFSGRNHPVMLVNVLNQYLSLVADAILRQEGTTDKFLGDAIMAWLNAPVPQLDHAQRAVRAAREIILNTQELWRELALNHKLGFGIGIHTGLAVLGLVGTENRMEFTAIGDCINTAKRIQENAAAGEILLSAETYSIIRNEFESTALEPVILKEKQEPLQLFAIK
jgi:adenylate cyclase